jgi:hypothetical protein
MKTYARVIGWEANYYGSEWHEVTAEGVRRFPSGLHAVVTINGKTVKAKDCEIVTVFTK